MTNLASKGKRINVNMKLSKGVVERMRRIQTLTDSSMVQVIRQALAVYDELVTNNDEGGHMVIHPPGDGKPYRLKLAW